MYPAQWRDRYGDEMEALLEDMGADARVVTDLLQGALRMRFSTWSVSRLAIVLALAGMLTGAAFSLLTPPRYTARAELSLVGADSGELTAARLSEQLRGRAGLFSIITDPRIGLYQDLAHVAPLDDVIEKMRGDIAVDFLHRPSAVIAIQFSYPDRRKALLATEALAAAAAEDLRILTTAKQPSPAVSWLDVVEPASLPSNPLAPDMRMMPLYGLAAGLVLIFGWRVGVRPRLSAWTFMKTSFCLALACTVAGGAMAWMIPPRYQSRATLYAEDGNAVALSGMVTQASSRTSLAALITDPRLRLYEDRLRGHRLAEVAEAMRREVVIAGRNAGGARYLDVSFTYPDRGKAQRTVATIVNRLEEEARGSAARRSTNWGTIAGGMPAVSVETLTPSPVSAVLTGLLFGLLVAALIALVRERWTLIGESPGHERSRMFWFSPGRFRSLALWLTAAGTAAGLIVAIRTPVRYTSNALVSFLNAEPYSAGRVVSEGVRRDLNQILADHGIYGSDSKRAMGDLTWQQIGDAEVKSNAFGIQFVSDEPGRAQSVLQDVLRSVDRTLLKTHGGDETRYDALRGVDGALLSMADDEKAYWPRDKASPAPAVTIPFDDYRANPVPHPEYRAVLMNVIDAPSLPSGSEGVGWWAIALGAAAGTMLSVLGTVLWGLGSWVAAKRPGVVAGASVE